MGKYDKRLKVAEAYINKNIDKDFCFPIFLMSNVEDSLDSANKLINSLVQTDNFTFKQICDRKMFLLDLLTLLLPVIANSKASNKDIKKLIKMSLHHPIFKYKYVLKKIR